MNIKEFTAVAGALSDSHRVRALMALRHGELCVCQLIELLSLAPSTVSKHMSILKAAGLVDSRKDSRWVYYRLPDPTEDGQKREIIKVVISLIDHDDTIVKDDAHMRAGIAKGLGAVCRKQRGG